MEKRFLSGKILIIAMLAIGVAAACANAYLRAGEQSNDAKILNTLVLMNQKLDLIWRATSSASSARNVEAESPVTELPVIQLLGGSIKLRFKRIGEKYHYECSIEGGIDTISRLVAPDDKHVQLRATFVDKDNFDVTDLTLAGRDFTIAEQPEEGKDVELNKKGVWGNNVDPAVIKNWRVEVLAQDNSDTKVGMSPGPTPSNQVKNLAADITVHPITGKLMLPGPLEEIQEKLAQATPAPTPQGAPVFQEPPTSMPSPSVPRAEETHVRIEEPHFVMPQQKPVQEKN